MQRISSTAAPPELRGAVAALGNFDGVHIGHQAVIAAARVRASALSAPSAVIVFEPHPRQHFAPQAPPFRLQTPDQRARAIEALGVTALFELRFDAAMAGRSAEAFAAEVLAQALGVRVVLIGEDFRFGRGRAGGAAELARFGAELGFEVGTTDLLGFGGEKISSSQIRAALREGRVEEAARLLGRPFAIEGEVLQGAQRGRSIGFPTANQALRAYQRPAFGVYAVEARLAPGERPWPGVANFGVKPTIGGAPEPLLETHLFDFAGDLYGRAIEVSLLHFLRPERRFDSFEMLRAQIAADAAAARALLRG